MKTKPKSIDDYLASLNAPERTALEALRKSIRAAAPKAEECISYGVPAFRLNGRMLVFFGAAKKHCSFYPGAFPLVACQKEVKDYDTSKGTIRFPAEKPLPAVLVRKLVKARIFQNAELSAKAK
jgi:uncharacterized protein YdhG (YjbR/CyaY superfamily)